MAHKKHMLIIEDDASLRDALVSIVEEDETYKVSHCENGLVALEWLTNNKPPDIILTDFAMVHNGAEIAEMARKYKIPVLMLTADPDRALKALEDKSIMVPVMAKPLDIFQVLKMADELTNTDPRLVEIKNSPKKSSRTKYNVHVPMKGN